MKKYIIDNLEKQKISGDITIDGNFRINEGFYETGTYKATLTQTTNITGSNLGVFYGALIPGETYTISTYVAGDDFSNIANVQSGNINESGCVFIATGETPINWVNESILVSNGDLIVNVLENNLGFNIIWEKGFPGVYFGRKDDGSDILYNSFPRSRVSVKSSLSQNPSSPPSTIDIYGGVGSLNGKDDTVFVVSYDWDLSSSVFDRLWYTPIEITFKQDLRTDPITISGSIVDNFPISYASIDLISNGIYVETFYADNTSQSSNINELVSLLNNDPVTNYLGIFNIGEGGTITLSIPTNKKNQFSPDGDLTFEVFND